MELEEVWWGEVRLPVLVHSTGKMKCEELDDTPLSPIQVSREAYIEYSLSDASTQAVATISFSTAFTVFPFNFRRLSTSLPTSPSNEDLTSTINHFYGTFQL